MKCPNAYHSTGLQIAIALRVIDIIIIAGSTVDAREQLSYHIHMDHATVLTVHCVCTLYYMCVFILTPFRDESLQEFYKGS